MAAKPWHRAHRGLMMSGRFWSDDVRPGVLGQLRVALADHLNSACHGLAELDARHRRELRAALVASLIAVAAYGFVSLAGGTARTIGLEHIDLDVYRSGARVLLDRGNLYGALPHPGPGVDLPFTYPPIAAMVLAPLAVLPMALDGLLSILLTVVLLTVVLRLVIRSLGAASGATLNWGALVALPAVLILDPVRVALVDGQIDVGLMALVVWDTLGGGLRIGHRRPRGALVGLAAAIKLTPAVFVLYFLVRGDRRAAVTSAVSFAGFTLLGFLVAPTDSAEYWGHTVFQTQRIGAVWYAANQSLRAALTRFGLAGRELSVVWALGVLLVLVLAWIAMRRATESGSPAGALVINALAELLISPISWTHHWVWIVPVLVAFGAVGRRTGLRRVRATTNVAFVLFALGPQWFFPHADNRELHWALWEQLVGSAYVWFALAILILAALPHRSPTPPCSALAPDQPTPPDPWSGARLAVQSVQSVQADHAVQESVTEADIPAMIAEDFDSIAKVTS